MSFWTNSRINKLKKMVALKHSAAEIAKAIGNTRMSVIGFCHRKKIKLLCERRGCNTHKIRLETKVEVAPVIIDIVPEQEPIPAVEPQKLKHVSLFDRRHNQCANIIGEPSHNSMCCGMPTINESSWCEYHARLNFKHD